MRNRRGATAIILLVVLLGAGCNSWRGLGFRASGPEMPRLGQVLALKPGMSVADVGAGTGEVTVALAAEVGPSGHVFSTDIDAQALEKIPALVAAAALQNVTVVRAYARDTGSPTNCCDAVVLRRVYHHLSDPLATNGDLRDNSSNRRNPHHWAAAVCHALASIEAEPAGHEERLSPASRPRR